MMLAGCGLSQPALWGAVEGGKILVGTAGAAIADSVESAPTSAKGGPFVTESNPSDTKPTEGYNPLDP